MNVLLTRSKRGTCQVVVHKARAELWNAKTVSSMDLLAIGARWSGDFEHHVGLARIRDQFEAVARHKDLCVELYRRIFYKISP